MKTISKILLIEDTPIIQLVTKQMLTILGCKVDIVDCGESALCQFNCGYDLILLDIGLPDMLGTRVCEEIRQRNPDFKTPIIAYTACGKGIESACRKAGVNDFVVKPLSLKGLNHLLAYWVPHYNKIEINE